MSSNTNCELGFSPDNTHASQMRGSWFPVSLGSAAAFHNTLANSANFLFQKTRGYFPSQDNAVALTHHHKALHAATELMKDPDKRMSIEALGTIESFICHHVS